MNLNKVYRLSAFFIFLIFILNFSLLSNDSTEKKIKTLYVKGYALFKSHKKKEAFEVLKQAFILDPRNEFIFLIHDDIKEWIVYWPTPPEEMKKLKNFLFHSIQDMINFEKSGTRVLIKLLDERLKKKLPLYEETFYKIVKAYCYMTTAEHEGDPPKLEMVLKAKKIFEEMANNLDKKISINGYIGLIETLGNEYAYKDNAPLGEKKAWTKIIEKFPNSFYAAKALLWLYYEIPENNKMERQNFLYKLKKYPNYKIYYIRHGQLTFKFLYDSIEEKLSKLKR